MTECRHINRQRRKFLIASGSVSVGFLISGCGGGGGSGAQQSQITVTGIESVPVIVTHPADQAVFEGGSPVFSVIAESGLLTYQWQRNGVNIPGASDAIYTAGIVTREDDGAVFAVVVANSAGSVISNQAVLLVSDGLTRTDSVTITVDSVTISVDQV